MRVSTWSAPGAAGEDQHAAEHLLPLVYDELRRIASHQLAREAPGHALQPGMLVHDAWLRLGPESHRRYKDRAHFLAVAAATMRRILIDAARHRQAVRHGGGQQRVELADVDRIPAPVDEGMPAVHEALEEFAVAHPRQAELVKLRFFVGLTIREAADALGVAVPTANRDWACARSWLVRELEP